MSVVSTDNFSRSDGYSKLNLRDGAQFWAQDANLQNSIAKDQRELLSAGISGYQLALFDSAGDIYKWGVSTTTIPVANIRASEGVFNGSGNGVWTFEMVDATHFKFKYNNDAWSGSILVTADGNTWDIDPGSCGFDIIFASGMAPGDTCTLVVSKALRMLGGELYYNGVANAARLDKGLWQIEGHAVEIPQTDIAGIVDNEFIYLAVTFPEIPYTTDPDLAHRWADGNEDFRSPSAVQPLHTVSHALLAAMPDESASLKIIVLAKAHNTATVITPDQIWPEPYDLQKVLRDTNPTWGYKVPTTPAGLTATDGYEQDLTETIIRGLEAKSFVRLECTASTEEGLAYYEFSVEHSAQTGGVIPLTHHSFHQVPWQTGVIPYFTLHDVQTHSYLILRVRVVDKLGVVSPWSTPVNYTVNTACLITDAVSYTVAKDSQRGTDHDTSNGFWVKGIRFAAGAQTDLLGVTIYVKEGSDPGHDIDYYNTSRVFDMFGPTSSRDIFIPWHGDHPYISVCPLDRQGVIGTAVKTDIDLTESLIVSGALSPISTLTKVREFNGFRVSLGGIHADADYVKIWLRDGSAPAQTDVYFYGIFDKDVQYIDIPCNALADMYIKVAGADRWGIEQDTVTDDNIDLSDCEIPAGDAGVVFTSGLLAGYPTSGYKLTVTSAHANVASLNVYVEAGAVPTATDEFFYGNFPWDGAGSNDIEIPWPYAGDGCGFRVMGVDDYGVEQANSNTDSDNAQVGVHTYIVAEEGAYYDNVQDALDAIVVDNPTRAAIHIMPGNYVANITLPALADDQVVSIHGHGSVVLDGRVNFNNAPGATGGVAPYEMPREDWLFQMYNVTIKGKLTRVKQVSGGAIVWPLLFSGCSFIFDDAVTTDPLIEFEEEAGGGGGGYLAVRFEDCTFYDGDTKSTMIYFSNGGGAKTDISFVFINCDLACDLANNLINIDSNPTAACASVAIIDSCRMQSRVAAGGYLVMGTYSSGPHITFVNNTLYTAGIVSSGGISLAMGTTIAGVAKDSNVLMPYAFLNTNQ